MLFTFGRIVCALLLIARSIAVPLVNLSKAVGASSGELVPIISVLHRKDGIGDLNRVKHRGLRQVDKRDRDRSGNQDERADNTAKRE